MAATRSGLLFAEGIGLVLLGFAALILPALAGIAAVTLFGWLLVLSGAIGLTSGLLAHAHAHRGLSLASAILALVIGVLLLLNPFAGAAGLALLIAAYLLLDGIIMLGLAFSHRARAPVHWLWLLLSGVVDIALALFLTLLSPHASALVLGVIVGLDLIAAGAALLLVERSLPAV